MSLDIHDLNYAAAQYNLDRAVDMIYERAFNLQKDPRLDPEFVDLSDSFLEPEIWAAANLHQRTRMLATWVMFAGLN